MMTLSALRAAIVATLAAIPDIGRVHDYERYAKQEGDFRALYVADIGAAQQIRGWHVRRVSGVRRALVDGFVDGNTWELRGFMAIDDAAQSEIVFDTLVESVRTAFGENIFLGDYEIQTVDDDGSLIALVESGPVLLAGVLCHSAKLRLVTRVVGYS